MHLKIKIKSNIMCKKITMNKEIITLHGKPGNVAEKYYFNSKTEIDPSDAYDIHYLSKYRIFDD